MALLASFDVLFVRAALGAGMVFCTVCLVGRGILVALLAGLHVLLMRATLGAGVRLVLGVRGGWGVLVALLTCAHVVFVGAVSDWVFHELVVPFA